LPKKSILTVLTSSLLFIFIAENDFNSEEIIRYFLIGQEKYHEYLK